MILGAVTIGERVERARIEDPFVVDQFVVFGTGSSDELVMLGTPVDAVGLDDGGEARLVLRRQEFVQSVLLQDLIVELRLSFGAERENADLTFGFTAGGQVTVVKSDVKIIIIMRLAHQRDVLVRSRVQIPLKS